MLVRSAREVLAAAERVLVTAEPKGGRMRFMRSVDARVDAPYARRSIVNTARTTRRLGRRILRLETLQTRPGLNEGAIHGEVLVGPQPALPRVRHDAFKERMRDVPGQEPLAIS
jgi:hypothetical protein